MKKFQDFLNELSNATLKSYIKKSEKVSTSLEKKLKPLDKKEEKHRNKVLDAQDRLKGKERAFGRQAEYGDAGYRGAAKDLGNAGRSVTMAHKKIKELEKGPKDYDAKEHQNLQRKYNNRGDGEYKASNQLHRTPEEHKDHITKRAKDKKEHFHYTKKNDELKNHLIKTAGLKPQGDRLTSDNSQVTHKKLLKAGFKETNSGFYHSTYSHPEHGHHISADHRFSKPHYDVIHGDNMKKGSN